MEKIDLISRLEKLKNEIEYEVRNERNGTKREKSITQEELKRLSEEAIIVFKENNILDLTRPDRNKDNDHEWFGSLYGTGGAYDISTAILHLKKDVK